MPKFLNDNNNNISNSTTPPAAGAMTATTPAVVYEESEVANDKGDTKCQNREGNFLNRSKVERIRRKFMGDSSTPIIGEEESDSNVESGKENNYDSGADCGSKPCGGIAAMKRNLLNENRSHNKSILLNSSAEVDEVVIKGKVSNLAKQWNRMRAMTLDVSVIKKMSSSSAVPSPVEDRANVSLQERACESLPYDSETNHYNTSNSTALGRSSSMKSNCSKMVDDRFARYFGLESQTNQNPVATVTPNNTQDSGLNSKSRRRSRSMPRGNPPAPPPQRPVDERIAKYFGINKSFSGCPTPRLAINKPRAIVKPQQRLLLDPNSSESESKRRRRSRSVPREDCFDELDKVYEKNHPHSASFCIASDLARRVKQLNDFDELNITAEDLSMADSEFDKLYLGVCVCGYMGRGFVFFLFVFFCI